jgi:hypothetical protein
MLPFHQLLAQYLEGFLPHDLRGLLYVVWFVPERLHATNIVKTWRNSEEVLYMNPRKWSQDTLITHTLELKHTAIQAYNLRGHGRISNGYLHTELGSKYLHLEDL